MSNGELQSFLTRGVELVAEDACGLVALNKPEGVRSHPNSGGVDRKALLQLPYDHERERFGSPMEAEGASFFLLNRLDAPTSGLILLARSEALARIVKQAFESRDVKKAYVALVKGVPPKAQDMWNDRLQVQRTPHGLRTRAGSGAVAAAGMRVLASSKGQPAVSLVELTPQTGRTHQLRVQCAVRHLPIVGDATYGDFRFNRLYATKYKQRRLFLHSASVQLQFTFEGRKIRFQATAPTPSEFERALSAR